MTSALRPHRGILALAFGLALAVFCALPAAAVAVAPHIPDSQDSDVCAMCHRTHTSASSVQWAPEGRPDETHSALLTGSTTSTADVSFCYSCHGVDAIGADSDVQSSFLQPSVHSLDPSSSPYGPSPKQCSDCHDSHGTARTASGTPYPALLRSYSTTTGVAYSGEGYCATCHYEPRGLWSGLSVYEQTRHYSEMTTAPSGVGVRCLACHEGHGSPVAPLLRTELTSPTVETTVVVTANDRFQCFACHPGPDATYAGGATYQTSSHGLSSKVVSASGEWASAETTRSVGDCQACHAAMGSSDGSGGVIPKLAVAAGPALCLKCHTVGGVADADLAALSYPATASAGAELVASWGPPAATAEYGRLAVYTQDATGSAPFSLVGPREYRLPAGAPGKVAVGDLDADGESELVVADPSAAWLTVFERDPLRGITTTRTPAIAAPADLVAVADVVPDASNRPEIAVVNRGSGQLYVYRDEGGAALTLVAGPLATGAGPSGLAAGDLVGAANPELAVTAKDADELRLFTVSGDTVAGAGTFPTLSQPVAAAIGDVWSGGKGEIVVLNAGEATSQVSIFDPTSGRLSDYQPIGSGESSPTAVAIGDFLVGVSPTNTSGDEVAVTMGSVSGTSAVDVFPLNADTGGLAAPQMYETGPRFNSGEVTGGDVDGDGRVELVVGNAGRGPVDGDRQLPTIQVFHQDTDGTALVDNPATYVGGGVEMAGSAPSLAVADLGGVGPSRHPWGAIAKSHESTETEPFTRHVECTDCHNVHEATSTVAAAPAAYGSILGAPGVSVTNVSASQVDLAYVGSVRYEYELCFKCHSSWVTPLQGRRDLAAEFNTFNPSVHAVEATASSSVANADSFVAPWGNDSVLYCKDCHGTASVSGPRGPHTSADAPILSQPYLGTSSADIEGLCYRCHKYPVYYSGSQDETASASLFTNAAGDKLHALHTSDWGLGCATCHVSHGSTTEAHLLSDGVGYTHTASGGTCVNTCHPGVGSSYAR